jgi:hypothetical protein
MWPNAYVSKKEPQFEFEKDLGVPKMAQSLKKKLLFRPKKQFFQTLSQFGHP